MSRGDVYRIHFIGRRGHEQHGVRYAVVVQADELLGLSTALVAPTSRSAAAASFRPLITLGDDTTSVLVEQVRAVDIGRLSAFVGRVSRFELRGIEAALRLVLAL